jgi:hypothetical protein
MTMDRQGAFATLVLAVALAACSKGVGSGGTAFGSGQAGSADRSDDDGDGDSGGGDDSTDGSLDDGSDRGDPPKPTTGADHGDGVAGSCCHGNDTPGCEDGLIETCVCAQDSFCCENVWDDLCAALVVDMGCGDCDVSDPNGPGTTTSGGHDDGDPPSTSTGGASSTGGATGADGDGTNVPSSGDCCEANGTPGCDDAGLETCVCASDDYCCSNEWDDVCVGGIEKFGCGSCTDEETGDEPGPGDCCEAKPGPGCSAPAIESCVCAQDAYCCSTAWDALCVQQVASFGCGTC